MWGGLYNGLPCFWLKFVHICHFVQKIDISCKAYCKKNFSLIRFQRNEDVKVN